MRPELVAEVQFTEWTRDGRLRHPSFRGLREDKSPEEIRMPQDHSKRSAAPRAQSPRAGKAGTTRPAVRQRAEATRVAGVTLSHPERVLYPEQGATKLAVASYYRDIERWVMPQLRRRPLVLVRCPQGRGNDCFYQKHPGEAISADIPRVRIREKRGDAEYVYVEELGHLIALVQAGTLELHVWGSRVEDVEHPDLLVFDLDPGEDVAWRSVVDEARGLGRRLDAIGLTGFVRTTGGKGLHVVVPLKPTLDWDQVKAFTHGVAAVHARESDGG